MYKPKRATTTIAPLLTFLKMLWVWGGIKLHIRISCISFFLVQLLTLFKLFCYFLCRRGSRCALSYKPHSVVRPWQGETSCQHHQFTRVQKFQLLRVNWPGMYGQLTGLQSLHELISGENGSSNKPNRKRSRSSTSKGKSNFKAKTTNTPTPLGSKTLHSYFSPLTKADKDTPITHKPELKKRKSYSEIMVNVQG